MNDSLFTSIDGGVCAPLGFASSGLACGIKEPGSPKRDLALIVSDRPCVAAATFTKNRVPAAPVLLSRRHLETGAPRAIVANSGNANACTGARGMEDAVEMTRRTAETLGLQPEDVFVASTGIIGMPLPMERLRSRFGELAAALQTADSNAAAEAIMTSDTRPKQVAIELEAGGCRIGGIAKGAGMIRPDMATMLAFITTDVALDPSSLRQVTLEAVEDSFNAITIDGDMSTNDTVFVLANGAAGSVDRETFRAGLKVVMLELAKKIVRDGERVTKMVEVRVQGAASPAEARNVANAVANSNLVKASWNGEDPNWGRVIHAVGHADAQIDPNRIDIRFGPHLAARDGLDAGTPLDHLIPVVQAREFSITIDLKLGSGEARVFSSDLSPEYVDFNRAEYALLRNRERQKAGD